MKSLQFTRILMRIFGVTQARPVRTIIQERTTACVRKTQRPMEVDNSAAITKKVSLSLTGLERELQTGRNKGEGIKGHP